MTLAMTVSHVYVACRSILFYSTCCVREHLLLSLRTAFEELISDAVNKLESAISTIVLKMFRPIIESTCCDTCVNYIYFWSFTFVM